MPMSQSERGPLVIVADREHSEVPAMVVAARTHSIASTVAGGDALSWALEDAPALSVAVVVLARSVRVDVLERHKAAIALLTVPARPRGAGPCDARHDPPGGPRAEVSGIVPVLAGAGLPVTVVESDLILAVAQARDWPHPGNTCAACAVRGPLAVLLATEPQWIEVAAHAREGGAERIADRLAGLYPLNL
jgi:hypothetical protein